MFGSRIKDALKDSWDLDCFASFLQLPNSLQERRFSNYEEERLLNPVVFFRGTIDLPPFRLRFFDICTASRNRASYQSTTFHYVVSLRPHYCKLCAQTRQEDSLRNDSLIPHSTFPFLEAATTSASSSWNRSRWINVRKHRPDTFLSTPQTTLRHRHTFHSYYQRRSPSFTIPPTKSFTGSQRRHRGMARHPIDRSPFLRAPWKSIWCI